MGTDYRHTPLWKRTLGWEGAEEHQEVVNRLRHSFEAFRQRAAVLAEEIKISMPMFTDHGIEHIDSLWDTASLLLPEDFPINPAEAFVLGGGFLLHDLAMGLSAYPGGAESLRSDPIYLKALAGESLSVDAADDERAAAAERALVTALRLNHAHQAARLVDQEFHISRGEHVRLLPDDELRAIFGEDIGRIAQSHWCAVGELRSFLSDKHGTDGSLPAEWEIDPLKLACILRLADATHIDSRRAPMLLHAFRPPQGVSRDHWFFQLRLNRPIVKNGRLEYTSNNSFPEAESRAWWLAFETLQMIDDELRNVEALCLDLGRPTFTASSVAGISTPERLASFVRTSGWTPIDATLKVTNVAKIVANLGGDKLYGQSPMVALRELIANSADASKLLAAYTDLNPPAVKVRLFHQGGHDWVELIDNGIGMLRDDMVSSLLDFGTSQWSASLRDPEFAHISPGEYKPRGRFGIGFFSIFMIAERVEVISLKYLHGAVDTAMLIFEDGLTGRPLFREVPVRERLTTNGTIVRARLKHPALSPKGLLGTDAVESSVTQMMRDRLLELGALLDVSLEFEGPDDLATGSLVRADEWLTLEAGELFDRIYASELRDPLRHEIYSAWRAYFAENEQVLRDQSNNVVGRAVLASGLEADTVRDVWWWPSPAAPIYVGGLRSDEIWNCIGAFVGEPLRADRNSAFPVASSEELLRWATTQMDVLTTKREASAETRYGAAELGRSVGVSLPAMPCGIVAGGEISPNELAAWLEHKQSVLIVPFGEINVFQDEDGKPLFREPKRGREIEMPDNAVLVRLWQRQFYPEEIYKPVKDARFGEYGQRSAFEWNPHAWWYEHGKAGSTGLLLEAILEAWQTTPETVALNFDRLFLGEEGDRRVQFPLRENKDNFLVECFRLRRGD